MTCGAWGGEKDGMGPPSTRQGRDKHVDGGGEGGGAGGGAGGGSGGGRARHLVHVHIGQEGGLLRGFLPSETKGLLREHFVQGVFLTRGVGKRGGSRAGRSIHDRM
jgi:hypothetical protein